jgi:hypothetical protein
LVQVKHPPNPPASLKLRGTSSSKRGN